MHKNTYLILFTAFLFASCSSSKNSSQTDIVTNIKWQKDSLVINGDDGDWIKPLPFNDEKLGFSWSVTNDKDNLYILVAGTNETIIGRILRGGMTVYINTHGVKEEAGAASIAFPTGNRIKKDERMLNDRPELQQNKHVAINAVQDYSLSGFQQIKTPENFDYGKTNAENIQLSVGLNPSGQLVYEAAVPLASFLSKNELNSNARKSIAIAFEIENIPGAAGSGSGGGIGIGGGLGFGSFGTGGGLGLSIGTGSLIGGGNRNKPGKPTKIWNEFTLAKNTVYGK